jgi:hypothetical protein
MGVFLQHLDNSGEQKFIIKVLDSTHMFISKEKGISAYLRKKVAEWQRDNSFVALAPDTSKA